MDSLYPGDEGTGSQAEHSHQLANSFRQLATRGGGPSIGVSTFPGCLSSVACAVGLAQSETLEAALSGIASGATVCPVVIGALTVIGAITNFVATSPSGNSASSSAWVL